MNRTERRVASLALLGAAVLLGIGVPTPWTGVGFLFVWTVFFLGGHTCRPGRGGEEPASVVARTALGLALAIVLWSLSAYVTKALWPGTLTLLAFAAAGLRSTLRALSAEVDGAGAPHAPPGVTAAVLIGALGLGLYVEGKNEIVRGDLILYSFRWDWDVHLYWASLVREQGLPLVGTAGSPEAPLERLMHTGLLCSIAGIEQLTRTTPYQAARILAVGCFALIALAGLALVRARPLPRPTLVLAALAPLVWGAASLPFDLSRPGWSAVQDPYHSGAFASTTAAGALYHNLTQLESVALAAAALTVVPWKAGGSWTLAALLTGAAGLVKPTTAAVLGPALLTLALWSRAGWRTAGRMIAAFAAAAVLLAMPVLVAHPPPGVQAIIELRRLTTLFSVHTGVWVGVSGICAGAWLLRGRREGDARPRVLALSCLAGLLLAAVWSEPDKRSDLNQSWGLNAALVLMAPLVVATALTARPLALRLAGTALVGLHLLSGALYAWHYPRLQRRELWRPTQALLARVRESTRPGTRLFVDMRLLPATGYAYLGRPTPFPLHLVQPAELHDAATWRGLMNGQDTMPQLSAFLTRRDAVVVGPWTRQLRPALEAEGFRLVWTDDVAEGELWVRPIAGARSSRELPASPAPGAPP